MNKLGCGVRNSPQYWLGHLLFNSLLMWKHKANPEGDTSQPTVLYQWSVGPFTVMSLESFLYLPFIFPLCLPMSRSWCFPLAKWQWGLEHHVLVVLRAKLWLSTSIAVTVQPQSEFTSLFETSLVYLHHVITLPKTPIRTGIKST